VDLNDVVDIELLKSIPNQPQVQCSLHDQLRVLEAIAAKFGLYDASDYLRNANHQAESRIRQVR
jgi:hypothetical protein